VIGTPLVRKKWRTSEIFRSGRPTPLAEGGAYRASVPTVASPSRGVPGRGEGCCGDRITFQMRGVAHGRPSLLLIVAEVRVVVALNCSLRNRRRPVTEQREQWVPLGIVAGVSAFPRDCA